MAEMIAEMVSELGLCANLRTSHRQQVAAGGLQTSLDVAVIRDGTPGEAQTMTARRVSGAFAFFCAAGARPVRAEAGITSSV